MAKVKNVSGDAWIDAETGSRVSKGGVLEIPDERAWGYVQMSIWEPADKATAALAEVQKPGYVPDEPVAAEVAPEKES